MAENVKKFKTFDGAEHELEDTQARADIADLAASTYTKDEVDSRLTGYAEKADVYDKTESYSKTEVDDALALKANAADVYAKTDTYDKTEVDSALTLKANVVDVYSKTETYNKTETDSLLGAKANSADVYTITQTDALLDAKAGIDDSSITATMATWSASKLAPEFQGKADASNVYNKTEVYTKAEVDALIGGIRMFPRLDWANPLFTFDSNNTSYTATQDCYLWISVCNAYGSSGYSEVVINSTALKLATATGIVTTAPGLVFLSAGDNVTGTNNPWTYGSMVVFKERS